MSEPREFDISISLLKGISSTHPSASITLIEKSAYDAVVKERDLARHSLEVCTTEHERVIEAANKRCDERDLYKMRLAEANFANTGLEITCRSKVEHIERLESELQEFKRSEKIWQDGWGVAGSERLALTAELAEAKALIGKGVKFESFCVVRINRLERALAYAKSVLGIAVDIDGKLEEIERLERGE